jgi:hypothetical protein
MKTEKIERIIFEKKGWRLSEVPYNYMVQHKGVGKKTFWTSIDTAINWIMQNSNFTFDELKTLTKGCPTKPRRLALEVIRGCVDEVSPSPRHSDMAKHPSL